MSEAVLLNGSSFAPRTSTVLAQDDELRSVMDRMSDCYVRIDGSAKMVDLNEAAARWVGTSKHQLLGKSFFETFNKLSEASQQHVRLVLSSRQSQHYVMESDIHRGRWIDVQLFPWDDGFWCVFRDVTQGFATRAALEKAQSLLSATLCASNAEIVILDEAGRILIANEAWAQFLAESDIFVRSGGIGEYYLNLASVRPIGAEAAAYRAGLTAVLEGSRDLFDFEYRGKTEEGGRNYRLHVVKIEVGAWKRIVVAREDITELYSARQSVDTLAARLVNLQERERQRYARELHDSTAQHLTAASLNLIALRAKIVETRAVRESIGHIERSIEEALREIRSVSYLLYPRALDQDGLASTLRRFVSGYSARTDIGTKLHIESDIDCLPIAVQRSVLRIVQEALSNAHRHAEATMIHVSCMLKRGHLRVAISDNGKGIRRYAGADQYVQSGVGISGMKARAHQFGGVLRIRGNRVGTLVLIRIPLSRRLHTGETRGRRLN
jgi:PAS domain S-box-containing protein